MRVLTYNIHGWKTADGRPNWDGVARVIEQTGADLVGLNEVFYPRAVEGVAGSALEALARRVGMHYTFGPCVRWPAQEHMPADAYGNALLSRWPIVAAAAHHLTPKEEDALNVLAGKEPRGLLEARILLPGGETLTVYVTHLDHTDEEARLVQLRVARTWLGRDRNRPHLVMGDFNAISAWDFAGHPELLAAIAAHPKGQNLARDQGPRVIAQMEKAGYVDTYTRFGKPIQRSYLPSTEPLRIDYIFASMPLAERVKSCEIWADPSGDEPSDHRPVLAELSDGRDNGA